MFVLRNYYPVHAEVVELESETTCSKEPLLPREGMPRPMTVVHFVPSISSLTTVIPSNCAQPENKFNVPPAKKVVQILPSGEFLKQFYMYSSVLPIDVHPIQVPIVNQVHSETGQNLVFQQNSVQTSHVIVNSSSGNSVQVIKDQNLSLNTLSSPTATGNSILPVQENRSTSLAFLQKTNFMIHLSSPVNFGENNLSTLKRNSPSGSPSHQPFRSKFSDIQWFNGESTELSFNTFLNSMESPTKLTSASTSSCLSTENSNFDTIARLTPVVDSQVRCLLDECSIDFITKFEDLADVINNSSSNDSKPS
ncbi:protein cramped-like [Caerostris extrusa]|uniref:Protein cramped-like n=1 Tax=Caerostris extrusa TaxID=172846 RepID=A0AAV4MMT1_CAEEX|nr:protein cramped-like [Caerostris extrusa]